MKSSSLRYILNFIESINTTEENYINKLNELYETSRELSLNSIINSGYFIFRSLIIDNIITIKKKVYYAEDISFAADYFDTTIRIIEKN